MSLGSNHHLMFRIVMQHFNLKISEQLNFKTPIGFVICIIMINEQNVIFTNQDVADSRNTKHFFKIKKKLTNYTTVNREILK